MNKNRYEDKLILLSRKKYQNLMTLEDKMFVYGAKEHYKMHEKFTEEQYTRVKNLYYSVTETKLCTNKKDFLIHSKELRTIIIPLLSKHSYREISKILWDNYSIKIGRTSIGIIVNELNLAKSGNL